MPPTSLPLAVSLLGSLLSLHFGSAHTHRDLPKTAEGDASWDDGRIAAVFPFAHDYDARDTAGCFSDVGPRKGSFVPELCVRGVTTGGTEIAADLGDITWGPYRGVSAPALGAGGPAAAELVAAAPVEALDNIDAGGGLTVSFWARNVAVNTNLFSIGDFSAVLLEWRRGDDNDGGEEHVVELRSGEDVARLVFRHGCAKTPIDRAWFWYSFSIDPAVGSGLGVGYVRAAVYSWSGRCLGTASTRWTDPPSTCTSSTKEEKAHACRAHVTLRLLSPPPEMMRRKGAERFAFVPHPPLDGERAAAFVTDDGREAPSSTTDVSFVVMHDTVITDEDKISALRQEAKRYAG